MSNGTNGTHGTDARRGGPDRLPPHAQESEEGLLSCCLQDPQQVLPELAATAMGRQAGIFYDLRHQLIYQTILELWQEQQPVDLITLSQRLTDRGQLEQVGGIASLSTLPDAAPSAANWSYYWEEVRAKYRLRKMLAVLADGVQRIYERPEAGATAATLDGIEAAVLAANQEEGVSVSLGMRDLTISMIHLLENMHRGVGLINGIRTRFGYLDKMTGGLHRKELAVLAARPSVGKTSLAMNIAVNVAKYERIPVGVFSMEMSAQDVHLRMACGEAGIDFHKLRTGFPSSKDLDQIAKICPPLSKLSIWMDETPALGILELRARARRMAQQYKCELFIVDYLQLMHGSRDYNGNRAAEVAEISGGLKQAAKELNAAFLVLSQLNREMEKNKNRKPQLADLRESGAIEQDADLVMMLYKPKIQGEEEPDEDAPEIPVNALIAKQRNGPTGDVELTFRRQQMQFVDRYENQGARPPSGGATGHGAKAQTREEIARELARDYAPGGEAWTELGGEGNTDEHGPARTDTGATAEDAEGQQGGLGL
jgi:replicative DNA helicase